MIAPDECATCEETPMPDAMYHQAGAIASDSVAALLRGDLERLEPSPRYHWIPMPLPWFWIFTFWRSTWNNYGMFRKAEYGTADYDAAPYELGTIFGSAAPRVVGLSKAGEGE